MEKIVIYKMERKSPGSQYNKYCPTTWTSGPVLEYQFPGFII